MSKVPGADGHVETYQEHQFFRALRELHRRAGQPSSRSIASKIGAVSHTTVSSALRGPKVPTWPIVAKIVDALDGDLEEIRELWIEAREPLEIRTRADETEVRVFISYARIDDQATYGRISRLVEDIANSYRSITGKTVGVFVDVESIKLGDDWRDRIRSGLSYSSIFLAFVTPAYLRSAECREELSEFFAFLEASSVDRLVIPLIFAKQERIQANFAEDDLWEKVSRRNYEDISRLRSVNPGSPEWIETVELLAERIDETLSSFEQVEEPVPSRDDRATSKRSKAPAPGTLDRMFALEQMVPQVTDDMSRIVTLMNDLGKAVTKAGPRFANANTFGARLAASKALAKQLDPIADDLVSTADRLVTNFAEWDFLVQYVLEYASNGGDLSDPQVVRVIGGLWQLATIGASSLSAVNQLIQIVSQGIGISRDLDRPFMAIKTACLRIADLIGILDGWKQGLQTLETNYLGDGYLNNLPNYLEDPSDSKS
jgi:TIR domain